MNVPGKRHIVRVHSTPPAGAAMAGRPTYTGYVAKKMMVLIAEWLGIKKGRKCFGV